MSGWVAVGLLGGVVGLDATSFPQVMISRPLVAGTLTGVLLGRPLEGAVIGFILEAFSLVILPIGAARYPESGTATVAAVAAYTTALPPGLESGALAVVLTLALGWEWVSGETVVLLRRNNGRILVRPGAMEPVPLERRHLAAMLMDFLRGAILAVLGGLLGFALLSLALGGWGLSPAVTWGLLSALVATMVATTLPLFGGAGARRIALGLGLGTGVLMVLIL